MTRVRAGLLLVLGLSIILAGSGPAAGIQIESEDGELTGSLDSTVTFGAAVRASARDYDIIGEQNGGHAWSINADDGNLGYGAGDLTSLSGRVTHELDLDWRNVGFFGRAYYFYDAAVMDIGPDKRYRDKSGRTNAERPHFTRSARRHAGWSVKLLDYYLNVNLEAAERPVTVRVGNQVISWGESTFIQNGINAINPVDVTQLRVAGAELRDALLPVPAVDVKVALNKEFSIEGFYQFYWTHTEIEPLGTYFSTTDIASPGASAAMLKFGRAGYSNPVDNPPGPAVMFPFGAYIPRTEDHEPSRQGEGGVAVRYFSPELNDTEFGLYWLHYSSRLPLISGRTGEKGHSADGKYSTTGAYFREFPDNIDLAGASYNTEIYPGLAAQGEVSYKFRQPLQADDVELLYSALSPVNPAMFPPDQLQLGSYGYKQYVRGYRRRDVVQAQTTVTQLFGPKFGSDQLVVLGEVGATWVRHMEEKSRLRYEAAGTFTSANAFFSPCNDGANPYCNPVYPAGVQPGTERGHAFADRFSWGYQLVAKADYLNAVGPINLFPILAFSQDVEGTTPAPIVNFIGGRKAITPRLDASYLDAWRASLAYTNYFDAGRYNLINDRDFVSLSVSYAF
jgi:hypothetical protein